MSEMIIGVDIGYGNTKTAHICMGSGISKLATKPPIKVEVKISSTNGFFGIGIIDKNNVWIITHNNVLLKK